MTENETKTAPGTVRLISRADDFGSFHAANLAAERAIKEGIVTSMSLMVCTPWFEEAADICRRNPDFQVGVHTTFTAEWQFYRWGPVLPVTKVPSLVAPDGCFHPQSAAFAEAGPDLGEFEAELRAQVDRALEYEVDVAYIDYHMRAARHTPELDSVLLRVAKDYRVPVSRMVGDVDLPRKGPIPAEQTTAVAAQTLRDIEPGLWLMVTLPGLDVPEMQAIVLSYRQDGPSIAEMRAAETEMLTSQEVADVIRERGIELVGYRDIRDRMRAAGEL